MGKESMLNIAHRGFTQKFPGNTMEAFEAAIGLEADALECDVQETADGRFVVFHDEELDGKKLGALSASQVRGIRLEGGYRVPMLEESLDLCRHRIGMVLEVKRLRSLDGLARILRAEADPKEVGLGSFDKGLMLELSRLAPEFRRGVIVESPPEDPVELLRSCGCQVLGVPFPYADDRLVEAIHRAGCLVFLWGFRELSQIKGALDLGIDGIVSDFPDVVKEELGARG